MRAKATLGIAVFAALLMAVSLAACASSREAKQPDRISLTSSGKVEIIEHKGTQYGQSELPQWVASYIDRGLPAVEALPDYKGKYCIIAEEYGPALQQLMTWVNNFNAQQQIGAQISTRVASTFKANENKLPDNDDSKRKYSNAINTLVAASYSGARKESDWWTHQRVTQGKESTERYSAIVLYSIDKKILDDQIKAQVSKLKDGTPALDSILDEITGKILEDGLDWEQDD
jgi:hypothetical protein